MPPSRANRKSVLLQIAVILAAALIYTGARYFIDQSAYRSAHAAYLNADCAVALPIYNQITGAFRLGDIGRFEALALAEKVDCVPFEAAAGRERSGDLPGALLAFAGFTQEQPGSPLAPAARQHAARLLRESQPARLADSATCGQVERLASSAGLTAADPALPGLYDACAALFTAENAPQSAYQMDYALLAGFGAHPLSEAAAARLSHNRYACGIAAELGADPAFSARDGYLPVLYETCGADYEQRGEFREAVRVYELFMAAYPDHPRAEPVRQALARALIAEARQSGAGQINLPEKVTGTGGTSTTVIIQNDSPQQVRLVFSGPVTRIEYLAPCTDCVKYTGSGPEFCPELGPIGEYELPSGSYEVLVEATDDKGVTPFTGSWDMEGGEYFSCFFIVEQTP